MNEISTFTNPVSGSPIRVVDIDGNPWFVTTDIARALGRSSALHIRKSLADDEKGMIVVHTLGGPQSVGVVSESGLYRLLMRSNSPHARPFQDWIATEVLPSIRKNGIYVAGQERLPTGEMSDDELLATAVLRAGALIERLKAERAARAKVPPRCGRRP